MTTEFNAVQAVDEVTRQLRVKYPDRPEQQVKYPDRPEQQLREIATDEVEYLQDRPVLDYVTVLAGRAAAKRAKKISSDVAEPNTSNA